VDRTGLDGRFDVNLPVSPLEGLAQPSVANTDLSGQPSIFTALTEQLGLKLERQQGVIGAFVIDQLEMPTPD
jgi:uncharacterized protein (TIGR03435 family)